MRAVLIRGVCSLCAAGVKGAGADEFEALGDAETEHFAATLCLGEPTEIKKGVRQSNGREVFCGCKGGCDFCLPVKAPQLPKPDPDLFTTVRK